jgi:hypothetical protein
VKKQAALIANGKQAALIANKKQAALIANRKQATLMVNEKQAIRIDCLCRDTSAASRPANSACSLRPT